MSAVLDTDGFRFACYLVASLTALVACASELRVRSQTANRSLWPTFWLLEAILLTAMGVAMTIDAADSLTDIARSRARSDSWYLDRRSLQVPVVASIGAVWIVSTVVAIWRVPPRRRYLPSAALVGTLMSFAAMRTVSLHHIDTLLYRRSVGGVRIVAVVEIALLVATTIAAAVSIRPSRDDTSGNQWRASLLRQAQPREKPDGRPEEIGPATDVRSDADRIAPTGERPPGAVTRRGGAVPTKRA